MAITSVPVTSGPAAAGVPQPRGHQPGRDLADVIADSAALGWLRCESHLTGLPGEHLLVHHRAVLLVLEVTGPVAVANGHLQLDAGPGAASAAQVEQRVLLAAEALDADLVRAGDPLRVTVVLVSGVATLAGDDSERAAGRIRLLGLSQLRELLGDAGRGAPRADPLLQGRLEARAAAAVPRNGLSRQSAAAITHPAPLLTITGGPGSGRSRTLVLRAAALVRTRPGAVLLVTPSAPSATRLRRRADRLLAPHVAARLTVAGIDEVATTVLSQSGGARARHDISRVNAAWRAAWLAYGPRGAGLSAAWYRQEIEQVVFGSGARDLGAYLCAERPSAAVRLDAAHRAEVFDLAQAFRFEMAERAAVDRTLLSGQALSVIGGRPPRWRCVLVDDAHLLRPVERDLCTALSAPAFAGALTLVSDEGADHTVDLGGGDRPPALRDALAAVRAGAGLPTLGPPVTQAVRTSISSHDAELLARVDQLVADTEAGTEVAVFVPTRALEEAYRTMLRAAGHDVVALGAAGGVQVGGYGPGAGTSVAHVLLARLDLMAAAPSALRASATRPDAAGQAAEASRTLVAQSVALAAQTLWLGQLGGAAG